jgi:hypothetical protein
LLDVYHRSILLLRLSAESLLGYAQTAETPETLDSMKLTKKAKITIWRFHAIGDSNVHAPVACGMMKGDRAWEVVGYAEFAAEDCANSLNRHLRSPPSSSIISECQSQPETNCVASLKKSGLGKSWLMVVRVGDNLIESAITPPSADELQLKAGDKVHSGSQGDRCNDSEGMKHPLAKIEERLCVPVFDSLKPELLKVAVFMNRFTIGICFGGFERYGFVTNRTWQA